jgi:CubicO group peptidase (beta-lactamase class C family)
VTNQIRPSRRARRTATAAVAGAALLLAACSSGTDTATGGAAPATAAGAATTTGTGPGGTTPGTVATTPSGPVPGAEWETADPAALGFDPAKLDELSAAAEAGGSNCLLVVRDGKIVEEDYYNGAEPGVPQEVWSATKSYSSTLVGIAQDEGLLSIDDPASEYIPEWEGTESDTVTVRDLVSNDSGRHYDYDTDYLKMAGGASDKTQFAIDLGQDAPPGTVWKYNNSAIQTLDRVLTKATGVGPAEYAQDKLLGPIGMADSSMKKDPTGNTLTFMGLQSTCRDMARFGVLMLNEGNWGGEQIVSEAWVDEATGQASQDLNGAYGYLWWINREGPVVVDDEQATTGTEATTPPKTGQMVPQAPDDVYWALGLGGQIIAVHPGSGTVAVRLAPTRAPEGSARFGNGDLSLGVEAALVDP